MDILYTCPDFVAAVKPVGLSSEDGPCSFPQALRDTLGGDIYPIHRLDLNVGGVMVYARTKFAAAQLSRVVQEGTMVKEYVALVHGVPPQSGDWTDLLWKDSKKNKVFVVKSLRKGVKEARLFYRVLAYNEEKDCSLLSVTLQTGRSHQIRVQFSHRKHPLSHSSMTQLILH